MFSRFHLIPERNGQRDGRTDRFAISISRVSMLTRDKNGSQFHCEYLAMAFSWTDRRPNLQIEFNFCPAVRSRIIGISLHIVLN